MLSLGNKLTLTTQPIYKFVNKYSIDFDGVDDRIITDGADTVAQNSTYSFWCKSSETGENKGVFGHGTYYRGAFHFNYSSDKPRLYYGGGFYVEWDDTSAQDDGEWHHWVVYVDINTLSNSKLYCDGVLQTGKIVTTGGVLADYTQSLTIGSDAQTGSNSFLGQIDEFAVYDRELTQAEITRMYNTYYSPNRVANGNFAQIGNEEVTNGDFSQIGSEEIVNGNFDTSIAIGTNGSGWSRFVNGDNTVEYGSGGVILTRGSNSSTNECKLYANTIAGSTNILTTGKNYKLTYTVVANTNVTALAYYVGGTYTNLSHNVGTHTLYFTQGSNQLSVFWNQTTSSSITIDNVSVKEVGQGFTFGDGWGMGENKAIFDATVVNKGISQEGILTSGKFYKISLDINVLSGTLSSRLRFFDSNTSGTTISNITSSGTYTFYALADKTGFQLISLSDNTAEYTVTNFTFKEVGQHWTVSNSDADNYVVFNGSTARLKFLNTSPLTQLIAQGFTLTSGKTYKLTVDVASVTSGSVKIDAVGMSEVFDTAGITTRTLQPTGNSSLSFYRNSADVDLTLNSVVIQELKHDATNLMLNHSEYQSANPLITSTKSMDFDGISDYMVANSTLGSFTGSFSCWIFFDTTGNFGYLLDARKNSGTGFIHINDTTSPVSIVNSSGTVYVDGVATINITSGKWHHVVVTGITLDITESIFFGSRHTEANYIHGKMTEVGLWDRTLTSLEVASLYNQGVPTDLLVSRGDYVATGLQGYWKMGDGTNDEYPVIYDQVDPTLGSELVTNGNFATEDDWQFSNTSFSAGAITFDANTDWIFQGISFTVGKTYKIVITKTGVGTPRYRTGYAGTDASTKEIQESGTAYFTATSDTNRIQFYGDANSIDYVLNSVSVVEVQGNPATMTNMLEGNITNQYPLTKIRNYYRMGDGILDGYPIIQDQTSPNLAHIPTTNILTYSEDFSQNLYAPTNATVTGGFVSPTGDNNAYKLTTSAANGQILFNIPSQPISNKSVSIYAKANTSTSKLTIIEQYYVGNQTTFDLNLGVIEYSNGFSSKMENVGNGWYRCTHVQSGYTSGQTNATFAFRINTTDSLFIFGSQYEIQSQATAYIKSDGIAAVRKSSTTNLETKSNGFSTWTSSSGATATANYIVSPDGTQNAARIQFTSNGFLYNTAQGVSSTLFTISCYAKRNDSGTQSVGFFTNGSGTVDSAWSLTSDWKRFTYTYTSTNTSNIGIAGVGGADVSVFGFQIEHQTQAETYVPTYGLPVTIDLFTENNYGTMTNMSASDIVEDTP